MEEELKTTNPNVKNEEKKSAVKKSKSKKDKDKKSFSEKVSEYKAEIKKIIWPNLTTVRKNTITVVCTSLIIGAVIFGLDTVYTTLINLVVGLIG